MRDRVSNGRRCRPFGLLDGMILVGGVAVGIVAGREVLAPDLAGDDWKRWFHPLAGLVLMLSSSLMVIFRLRTPRPPIRRVADQPGFVACLSMVAFGVASVAVRAIEDLCNGRMEGLMYASYWGEFVYVFAENLVITWSVPVEGGSSFARPPVRR